MGITWVEANAGSGKTTFLINSILSLIENGHEPSRIVCLTYTRLAALEIKERLRRRQVSPTVCVDTLHGFCWKHVLLSPLHVSILDQDEQRQLAKEVIAGVFDYCERENSVLRSSLTFLRENVSGHILKESLEACVLETQHQAWDDKCLEKIGCFSHGLLENISGSLQLHFLRLALAVSRSYEVKKQQASVLDYADILKQSCQALSYENLSLRYDIDTAFDHFFVDEAQDLSQIEWQIIERLTDEFFHGISHKPAACRSLFVVGDLKQSIFSFQGACPQSFLSQKRVFREKARQGRLPFQERQQTQCFRTGVDILNFVDGVAQAFNPTIFAQKHYSVVEPKGFLHLWDLSVSQEALGRRIVQTIGELNVPLHDILILFHTRGRLWQEVSAQLVAYGLLSTVFNPLPISEKPIGQVALACTHVVLNPRDDYHMARVLTSAFVQMSSEALFSCANGRTGALVDVEEIARQPFVMFLCSQFEASMTPYAFFTRLFGSVSLTHVQQSERDELLDQVLRFEEKNLPSLTLFLEWIYTRTTCAKQDAERTGQVQLMTVHGAKGLEAPYVFLPDTLSVPNFKQLPRLLPHEGGVYPCLWRADKVYENEEIAQAKARWLQEQIEEYQRLLYVALTRAKRGIFVGGSCKNKPDAQSWYTHMRRHMESTGIREEQKSRWSIGAE